MQSFNEVLYSIAGLPVATEFFAWAEMEGADVLQGQAIETGGQLPYTSMLVYARDSGQPVMESTAINRLANLALP
jgi:hypothetical protein